MADRRLSLAAGSFALALEAQQVMALRMLRLAGGGAAAQRECRRMVTEKGIAAAEVGFKAALALLGGKNGDTIARAAVRDYRTRVRKNRKRLSGSGR